MSDHAVLSHASDQNAEPAGSRLTYPATPTASLQADSPRASPQPTASASVAHINTTPAASDTNSADTLPASGYLCSSNALSKTGTAYVFAPGTDPMEKEVRLFNSADGASFIEHVPGHCLVFIPNTANVDYLLREMRKVRQPKPRAKPKEKSGKPTNAFIKYRNYKIAEFKANNPEISQTEISRMAGEWWRNEPDEVKMYYQRQYQEEKRIYDMNKTKRARTESEAGSDTESHSDVASIASLHNQVAQISTMDFSMGLGLDAGPAGFYQGRRRSQTLPSGGFARSGTKRRISQELRKHLASKSSNAYMAANPNADMFNNNGAPLPPFPTYQHQHQPQPPAFEFTFTPPLDTSAAPQAGTSAVSYVSCDLPSLAMPLNPSFPIAEFSTAGSVSQPISHHSRSLTSMSTPLSIDNIAYSSSGEGFETYVPAISSVSRPAVETSVPCSLPLLDTANLNALANDGMSMTAFNSTNGYMSADAQHLGSASAPWQLAQSYSLLPDAASTSSGPPLHQNQQM